MFLLPLKLCLANKLNTYIFLTSSHILIVYRHKKVDSAPFYYGRQNAQHIAAASIHSYYKYTQNSGELQWGDGFFLFRGPCFNTGSFPLARGILLFYIPHFHRTRITPAYAGNTIVHRFRQLIHEDHPHLRGEYHFLSTPSGSCNPSPPLTRGIPSHPC